MHWQGKLKSIERKTSLTKIKGEKLQTIGSLFIEVVEKKGNYFGEKERQTGTTK